MPKRIEDGLMKKCLLILFFLIFPFVPTQVLAELNNLMWAVFPVEKYEYMVDKKTEKYMKNAQLKAIGRQETIGVRSTLLTII